MLTIKPGVRVRGLSNEILLAIIIAKEVFAEFKEDLTITSLTDGKHMSGSLHYTGDAVDLRLPKDLSIEVALLSELQAALETGYDVVWETNHIHIEYDPV